jgi:hypothetical protein
MLVPELRHSSTPPLLLLCHTQLVPLLEVLLMLEQLRHSNTIQGHLLLELCSSSSSNSMQAA